jgi:hypothetical protein
MVMNPAHRAHLAALAALEQRIGHDRRQAAELARVELMTPQERADEYRRIMAEAPPIDPAEIERLRGLSPGELVDAYRQAIKGGR